MGSYVVMQPKEDAPGIAIEQKGDIGSYSTAETGRYKWVAMQKKGDTGGYLIAMQKQGDKAGIHTTAERYRRVSIQQQGDTGGKAGSHETAHIIGSVPRRLFIPALQ